MYNSSVGTSSTLNTFKGINGIGTNSTEYNKTYYQRNKEKILAGIIGYVQKRQSKEYYRNFSYKRKYGITLEEYNSLAKNQNEVCAICLNPETSTYGSSGIKHLSVDHCHTTGKIRGLLCHDCNTGLGKFKDNQELLQLAINYLRKEN